MADRIAVPFLNFALWKEIFPLYPSNNTYQSDSTRLNVMYEPWNPTANTPYIEDLQPPALFPGLKYIRNNFYNDAAPENIGYRPHANTATSIFFTVRFKLSILEKLIDMNVESFSLYVAETDPDKSQLMSIGWEAYTRDVPATLYGLPKVKDFKDFTKFRLVKTFLFDGDGAPFADGSDINKWKTQYEGQPTATNAWIGWTDSTYFIATGQDLNGKPNGILTPDFCLWDYGVSSPALSLNSSGKYFQGRASRLVANIKGRTFLGGTIDKYGEEEQGIIRYSDVQSGVISLDVFSEENFLRVGGMPHTALVEFREMLWVFNEGETHRIQMPNVAAIETWEYLDKFPGQGTWSPKTVITTPFGVFWCNESGVWASDGRMPENMALPILSLYKKMATNTPNPYAHKVDIGEFPYSKGRNPYLEISYDETRNEIVLSSPVTTEAFYLEGLSDEEQVIAHEYRLVFSFAHKNWRAEKWEYPEFGTPLSEFNRKGVTEI